MSCPVTNRKSLQKLYLRKMMLLKMSVTLSIFIGRKVSVQEIYTETALSTQLSVTLNLEVS